MIIRKAKSTDANDLKVLYFEYLTHFPPKEEQDMILWQNLLDKFEKDENMYLLVVEEDGKVVSSVQMAIIEGLTHNVRPFAVIENVLYTPLLDNISNNQKLRIAVLFSCRHTPDI